MRAIIGVPLFWTELMRISVNSKTVLWFLLSFAMLISGFAFVFYLVKTEE